MTTAFANVTIDGVKYSVSDTYSDTTLNEFLRKNLLLSGTKVYCREGGCGACVVYVEFNDPNGNAVQRSINSCMCPIMSCDNWNITTIEGIGNQTSPHVIQKTLTEYYGSQCGYCTSGMIMNMYSLMKQFPGQKLTKQLVEDSFDGNICRCTGYRPILDAFKSLASSAQSCENGDIEDLIGKVCKKTGKMCLGRCDNNLDSEIDIPPLPRALQGTPWYQPHNLTTLFQNLNTFGGKKVFLVAGRTSVGVYRDGPYDAQMDLKRIPDLFNVEVKNELFVVGSGVNLNDLIAHLEEFSTMSGFEYFTVLATHMKKIANVPVRNIGSWTGNLMMKRDHQEFPSDVYLCFELAQAVLTIGTAPDGITQDYSIQDFLKLDMRSPQQKVILRASFQKYPGVFFSTYKIMPRSQNAHALVNAGIRADFSGSPSGQYNFSKPPALVFGNINSGFFHATQTEQYLNYKNMADPDVLKTALQTLQDEVKPDVHYADDAGIEYRNKLSCALFYKFALQIMGSSADARFRSAVGSLVRPISSGQQSYPTNPAEYPLTQPIPKIESLVQCTGEAVYISDTESQSMHYAAFAVTTQGNADISSVDTNAATKVAGVVRVLLASDIPGSNNFTPPPGIPEELLASRRSEYAGQPVALVVASSQVAAEAGAAAVVVNYTNIKTPILTAKDAFQAKSFHPSVPDLTLGDAQKAYDSASKKIQGSLEIGSQFHFHFETQTAVCYPLEDGFSVESATQWVDSTQDAIAMVLGVTKSKINVSVKRIGGSYGAKISRANIAGAASALASNAVKKPVKMHMSIYDNMKIIGKRSAYYTEYQVGFDENGKLQGVIMTVNGDMGIAPNDSPIGGAAVWGDNCYYCPNWKMTLNNCKTNLPAMTWTRAPGSTEFIYFMEYVMEHIAKVLNKPALDVRRVNLYQNGETMISGETISLCTISDLTSQILTSSDYQNRLNAVNTFNQNNRWRKKGIMVTPSKYGCVWNLNQYCCTVAVYRNSGSVAVAHGGVELGQGINTKVAQVVAYELGIPLDTVSVKPNSSLVAANATSTGGSVTSELCCLGAIDCCTQLLKRFQPVKDSMPTGSSWPDLVDKCYGQGIDLTARSWVAPATKESPIYYNTYGVTVCEVEMDVLTGENQINRYDILYDCGESMSPLVDVGQIEGAVVMGLGYYTTEELRYDQKTGQLLTYSTWTYKPPASKDIPIDFRVQILQNAPNPLGVLRSKIVAEPPLCMTNTVVFALRNACNSALDEIQKGQDWFPVVAPMTHERVQTYCQLDISQFTYK